MTKLMKTGIEGLDRVLDGGFLHHNAILLKGEPGAGKTTLGIQIVYNGAMLYDEPGIVVLFEQFPQQLFRDVQSYNWNLEKLVAEDKLRTVFALPDQTTARDAVSESPLMWEIHNAMAEINARRILIDSVSQFLHMANSVSEARDKLLRFVNGLKSLGLTPIFTAERENREGAIGFDEYLTDCVVLLSSEAGQHKSFPVRELEVRKTRGHSHLRGRHPLKITPHGVEIYPRLSPSCFETPQEETTRALERIPSGVDGLDELLGGGYTRGTANIVAGMPGTYKTTLGAQFAAAGANAGEPSLIVTLNEQPAFLAKIMEQKGVALQQGLTSGALRIVHHFPHEVYAEELLAVLEQEIAANGTRRLVIDSVNDLESCVAEPEAARDMLRTFLALCAARGVTSLFTQKLDHFTGNAPLTDIRHAAMFDGIVYVSSVEIESSVHKVISVLKMRGADYATDLREIGCGDKGLYVLDKFVGLSGILAGNVQGQYKRTVEEIFQPLYFVRDFLEILSASGLEAEQRQQVQDNLRAEMAKLVDKLQSHFDVKG